MNKIDIIKRMRERDVKWKDVAYVVDMTESAAQMSLKRKRDIEELGEIPIIKKSKFKTPIHLRIKQLARDNPKLAIRDFGAILRDEFPGEDIPQKTTIHKILNDGGFKMVKLLKKTFIWPRNQLKRLEFCKEMVQKGPIFWKSVIWSDETTVRQCPKSKKIVIEYTLVSKEKNCL
jgi:hypothetical protein